MITRQVQFLGHSYAQLVLINPETSKLPCAGTYQILLQPLYFWQIFGKACCPKAKWLWHNPEIGEIKCVAWSQWYIRYWIKIWYIRTSLVSKINVYFIGSLLSSFKLVKCGFFCFLPWTIWNVIDASLQFLKCQSQLFTKRSCTVFNR